VPETKSSTFAKEPRERQNHPGPPVPTGGSYAPVLRNLAGQIVRYTGGLSIIVLIMVLYVHGGLVNSATVGFVLLLAILCASTLWGLSVAVVMSVAATLAYDYFVLPPVGTLNINDPRDWVALTSFVATAVIGSYLSARARREAQEANRRRQEAEGLYDFSQRLLRAGNPIELLEVIPRYVVESFQVGAASLILSDSQQIYHSGDEFPEPDPGSEKAVAAGEGREENRQTQPGLSTCVLPIRLKEREIGHIRISRATLSQTTLRAMQTLIAIAVERARMIENAAKIEAAQEHERLKTVLLDAITHDFRTPLTSIKGSATGLLANVDFDRDQRKELLLIIDEECDRIDQLISEVSEIARLEAGQVKVELAPHSIGELISAALAARKGLLHSRPILFEVKDPNLQILADLTLALKVVLHLIDNANLYSSEEDPITLSTGEKDGFALVSVSDHGRGIDEAEIAQIFEKFYRGKNHRHRVPGTGMGLAIAKAIVEAHGGAIGVVSRAGNGSVFTFSLPLVPAASAPTAIPEA
jgi:two-component system, OmpR family, sensor histidine kinase KdpD